MRSRLLATLVPAIALTAALPAQVTWTQLTAQLRPERRYDHAIAYDTVRERVVLFGGVATSTASFSLSDTWEWNGVSWAERNPSNRPPQRHGHAVVYDEARQRVVLFGGLIAGVDHANDTWE